MADEQQRIDYQAVLADLRAKRDRLDQLIAGLEQVLPLTDGIGSMMSPTTNSNPGVVTAMENDTFFNMSASDAVKKYLAMAKKKQSAKQISDALERGGMISASKNFYNTAYTALQRLEVAGEVMRVGKEWGLAEWYRGRRGAARKPSAASGAVVDDESGAE